MAIDIPTNYPNPMNQNPTREYERIVKNEKTDVKKITKECVDKLIEDIDRILKGASR